MQISIHADHLGTNRHLLYNGDSFSWVRDLPDNSYVFGSSDGFDLRESISVSGEDISTFEESPHGKAIRSLVGRDISVPWFQVMPDSLFKSILSRLLDDLWMFAKQNMGGYYIDTLSANRELLDRLQQPFIDVPCLKSIISKSSQAKAYDLVRFLPKGKDNLAPKTSYSMGGSITGRLTVSDGPNILTLKKSHRQIIKSRFDGGKIVQADISSLEPRIALSVAGKDPPEDIYSYVCEKIFNGELSRSQAKKSILTCIYGGSSWTLGKSLSKDINPKKILKDVKEYFEIDKLNKTLEAEILDKGFITNLYGRKIMSGESLVNHFLQSTGVDVSLSVFRSLLSSLDDSGDNYVPIYVIHDAIVLDVSSSALEALRDICKKSFQVDGIKCKFPLKIDIIS